ncbi:MAG: DEAD/DEAH box helicase, partial [Planctomycetota bacterium]
MSEIDLAALPEALRTALESRGFEGLTAVQAAVLEPENRGRDLRISSQTGSGKTVALGIAAFEAIQDALGLPLSPGGPSLLVIVPTRELASQVAEELGWLYAGLEGLRIDCVTGGTSVLAERRRLDHPPHVLVGTPGRLLDHLEAGALNLGEVAELVLDEADQMLDMGFRDELEGILERTPEERRTHLVSATLPAAILELAELYQRDAKAVEGTALGEANADIEHIAVRVVPQDRYAALTNLLLAAGDERTLVFVATRAGASQLADRLADDGFAALPLSGELAQAQRTRTLTSFRSGVARILVA